MLFVPRGLAHGFLTLEDDTEFLYKCDDIYDPGHEGGIIWNDNTLAIDWSRHLSGTPEISKKDSENPTFEQYLDNPIF